MKRINTRIHGLFDYMLAMSLIVMPWIFQFASDAPETSVPVTWGTLIFIYTTFTNFKPANMIKMISLRTHLLFDILGGLFLAASPWIFGFSGFIFLPHLLLGGFQVLIALMTKSRYYYPRLAEKRIVYTTHITRS